MCNKEPLGIGENSKLGKYKVFRTGNGARLYVWSENFGNMNMQGKKYQEEAQRLLEQCHKPQENTEKPPEKLPEPQQKETKTPPPENTENSGSFFKRLFGG